MSQLRIQLKAGETLFREGDAPTSAFLIEQGDIEVSTIQHGRRLVFSRLGAGDLLGEMAVLDDSVRTATAVAVSDCVLFAIDREQIAERLAATDPIIRALMEGQLKRYRGALAAMQGRPAIAGADPGLAEQLGADKIRLETHLREALLGAGLDVRYQPQLELASGRIAGYEALVRWTHPERGEISPTEFVALAEETSLIVPVGQYVIDTACLAIRRMIDAGVSPLPFIAVNVSSRQLAFPGLIEGIVARVDAAGLPRGSLKIEITESLGLDYEQVAAAIELCHQHGIGVALDDFGTGHSHLMHMHKLAFDTLKVDQSFSATMLEDPRSMAIVEAIVHMGKALGARIVVEGIETPAMLEALARLGGDYAQGYLIGRPQTLAELLAAHGGSSPSGLARVTPDP